MDSLKNLQQAINGASVAVDNLVAQNRSLEKENKSLQTDLKDAVLSLAECGTTISQRDHRIKELSNQLSLLQADHDAKCELIRELRATIKVLREPVTA